MQPGACGTMDAIVIRGLTKVYKALGKRRVQPLRGLDLTVCEGEVFGFLGRNGAGKTTTIKILCGLLKASGGETLVMGEKARARNTRRLIGYLPEQPYFYEYLTPKETLDFYGQLRGLTRAQRSREWDKLSELLDLRGIASERIKGFSKGMRQRVGFAVALVGDPPVLILDEPMSGLDPIGRRMIRELIVRQRDAKKTLFFSSHVLGDVEQICDRVGILVGGRLAQEGRIDELVRRQIHEVEVIAANVPEALVRALEAGAAYRRFENLDRFTFADSEAANAAVQEILAAGGALVEYNPLKESLEDYFMREQDAAPSAAREDAP